jgi:hypothetical protein
MQAVNVTSSRIDGFLADALFARAASRLDDAIMGKARHKRIALTSP